MTYKFVSNISEINDFLHIIIIISIIIKIT